MKRMLVSTVLIGIFAVLNLTTSVQAAPEPGTPKGKEHYSSRPKNYRPPTMLGPTLIEGPAPQETIETDGPVAAMPAPVLRRAPEPPKSTVPTWTAAAPNQSIQAPRSVEPKPEPIVINENSKGGPISSVGIPTPAKKPLPVEVAAAKKETPKDEDDAAVLNFVPKKPETKSEPKPKPKDVEKSEEGYWEKLKNAETTAAPKHEILYDKGEPAASDPDDFNARLAKIQLEKHNLSETLALIEKIKSPNFKVKTLVDLAEYVSRDVNYKREADTLYGLALNGVEALVDGKPVLVKVPSATPTAPARTAPFVYQPPKKTVPTLIEEEKPAESVKAAPVEEPKLAPVPTLVPELKPEPKPETPKPEVKAEPKPLDEPVETPKPAAPTPTRAPILLDSQDVKPKNEVEPKTEMPSLPKLAPTPSDKTGPAASSRPNILLTEEPKKDEPKTAPAVEKPEGPKKTKLLPPEEIKEETEKTEPAPKPKSTKRPMPGKRVVLEDN